MELIDHIDNGAHLDCACPADLCLVRTSTSAYFRRPWLTTRFSVNASLQGKWAALACHETGSLVVQHAFENLEETAKDGIVDELLNQGPIVFAEVAKNQWGAYCVQHSMSFSLM